MLGSWVLFRFDGKVRLGYVDSEYMDSLWIHEPGCSWHHTRARKDVAIAPDILHPEDRAALIDIALDMRDREWFYSLVRGGDAVVTTHGGE
jgi:hypothetical protein